MFPRNAEAKAPIVVIGVASIDDARLADSEGNVIEIADSSK